MDVKDAGRLGGTSYKKKYGTAGFIAIGKRSWEVRKTLHTHEDRQAISRKGWITRRKNGKDVLSIDKERSL